MTDSEIFDRNLRRIRRDRAARMVGESRLLDYVGDDLFERASDTGQPLATALVMNAAAHRLIERLRAQGCAVTSADPGARYAAASGGLHCDEDRYRFGTAQYDLIVSVGLLDTVNDVPGALVLMRHALKPGGLMLCSFAGAGSFETTRGLLRAAAPNAQYTHPMIDVRAGGDLLARAGFVRPMADVDNLRLDYADLRALARAMRAHAATNLLVRRTPLTAAAIAALRARLSARDGLSETLSIVTLTGWAPPS